MAWAIGLVMIVAAIVFSAMSGCSAVQAQSESHVIHTDEFKLEMSPYASARLHRFVDCETSVVCYFFALDELKCLPLSETSLSREDVCAGFDSQATLR